MSAVSLLARLGALESTIWRLLAGWVFRRPLPMPPGGRSFGYARAAAPAIWVFVAVSAFEIPLVDLLIPSWTWRIVVAILGLWGVLWMVGLVAVQYRHPHVVGPEWLRARSGFSLDVLVPWDVVGDIRRGTQTVGSTKSLVYSGDVDERTRVLAAVISSQTNVLLTFRQPLEIVVGGRPEVIDGIRLWADDPDGLVAAARQQFEVVEGDTPIAAAVAALG